MNVPVIVSDQGDISVFETVRDLEHYVESPDAADCRVYDATGRRYFFKRCPELSKGNVVFHKVESVQLDQDNPGPHAGDELIQLLRSYVRRVERGFPVETLSLQQLVQKTIELSGYTR